MNSPAIWNKSIFLSTTKKKKWNKKENLYLFFYLYIKENNHVCHDHDVQINSGRTSLNMPLAGLQWTFHTVKKKKRKSNFVISGK